MKKLGFKAIMKLRRRQASQRGVEKAAQTGGVESIPYGCGTAMQVAWKSWAGGLNWHGGLGLAPSGLPQGSGPQSKDEKNKQIQQALNMLHYNTYIALKNENLQSFHIYAT